MTGTVHFSGTLTSSQATIMDSALVQVFNTAKADTMLILDDALRVVRSHSLPRNLVYFHLFAFFSY